MNSARLRRFFEQRRARGEPMVLVQVTATEGSTYSKAGDLMLIDQQGVACGMLSGGCLESDLAARAQVVLESGKGLKDQFPFCLNLVPQNTKNVHH